MFEKAKDFFFDVGDILLSVLIIAIMFYTISWKLSDTMSYTPSFNIPFLSTESSEPEIPVASTDDTTHITVGDTTSGVVGTEEAITDSSEGEVIDMTPPEASGGTETVVEATPTETAKPESDSIQIIATKDVEFVVPSGMLASKIIQKLEDEGLIKDKTAFSSRLSERKLDSKLRSGTFKLSTDMTYDQIINKLTGQ